MLESLSYNGKELGYIGDHGHIVGPTIIKDSSLEKSDVSAAIRRCKSEIAKLSETSQNLYEKYYSINNSLPLFFGILVPAAVISFLKVTNVDDIYISSGVDLKNYASCNGHMLSFSDFVSGIMLQASVIYTPLTLVYNVLRKRELVKSIDNIEDDITYYQLVLGALRKRANELGMPNDYIGKNNMIKKLTK